MTITYEVCNTEELEKYYDEIFSMSNALIEIRACQIPEELHHLVGNERNEEEHLIHFMSKALKAPKTEYNLVFDTGCIVGYITTDIDKACKVLSVDEVYMKPDYQETDILTTVFTELANRAERMQMKVILLTVPSEDMSALATYAKLGYKTFSKSLYKRI